MGVMLKYAYCEFEIFLSPGNGLTGRTRPSSDSEAATVNPTPPPDGTGGWVGGSDLITDIPGESLKSKVMAVFGLGHLEHIPPQHKNAFRGVRGVQGAPRGRFFSHVSCFSTKNP